MNYFKMSEFECSCCGKQVMSTTLLSRLERLRAFHGKPIIINSGYRCKNHPIEKAKLHPGKGSHCHGVAVDIKTSSAREKHELITGAIRLGFRGIGVAKTFIHLDISDADNRPAVWAY